MRTFKSYVERRLWVEFAKSALHAVPRPDFKDLVGVAASAPERMSGALESLLPAQAALAGLIADHMLDRELKTREHESELPDITLQRLMSELYSGASALRAWSRRTQPALNEAQLREFDEILESAMEAHGRAQQALERYNGDPQAGE